MILSILPYILVILVFGMLGITAFIIYRNRNEIYLTRRHLILIVNYYIPSNSVGIDTETENNTEVDENEDIDESINSKENETRISSIV